MLQLQNQRTLELSDMVGALTGGALVWSFSAAPIGWATPHVAAARLAGLGGLSATTIASRSDTR